MCNGRRRIVRQGRERAFARGARNRARGRPSTLHSSGSSRRLVSGLGSWLRAGSRRCLRQTGQSRHRRGQGKCLATSAQEEAEENADRLKAEAVKFVVDTNAEADRLKAEADELTTKAKRDAEATLAKAKAEASEIHEGAKAEAQDTLARSQAEADERRRHLEAELAAMQEKAETQLREISADTQAVWSEHDQMLDGIRNMANDLIDIATASVARVQPHQPGASDDENPERGSRNHDEPTTVATDESASAAQTEDRGAEVRRSSQPVMTSNMTAHRRRSEGNGEEEP